MSGAPVDLTDAIDVKILLSVLAQVKGGDFTARMPLEWTGVAGKAAAGLNDVIIANQALAAELARVSRVVGKQGELSNAWCQEVGPSAGLAASNPSTA